MNCKDIKIGFIHLSNLLKQINSFLPYIRSKNDDFDQSEGENHREMDNSFDESPVTHDGAQLG